MKWILPLIAAFFINTAVAADDKFVLREMYAENGDGGILTITNIPCKIEGNPLYGHGWIIKTEMLDETVLDGCYAFGADQPVLYVFWSNYQKTIIKDPDAVFSTTKPIPKKNGVQI